MAFPNSQSNSSSFYIVARQFTSGEMKLIIFQTKSNITCDNSHLAVCASIDPVSVVVAHQSRAHNLSNGHIRTSLICVELK
jgi:hypothetical protein